MNSTTAAAMAAAVGGGGCRPLFTASQWQELEHQALIFKYMMAGIPVPPDLLLPIRKSFDAMAARFYHHPTMGYCSFYGKKLDPEPGRCRRTDGKKWRCSKDAYPDSKYCERHMHRGRNRSRKPVESQTQTQTQAQTQTLTQTQQSQSPSSSSTVTSLTPTGSGGGNGSFQSGIPLHSLGSSHTQLQMDHHGSYPLMGGKDYRYLHGVKVEDDEHNFFSGAVANPRGLDIDSSSLDSSWRLMPSQLSSFPMSKGRNASVLPSGYAQMQPLQDLGQESINSLSRQQHCFFGNDYGHSDPPKQESQSLRPFFDEWPKARDTWSELEDERSNRTSFSTTQLSISIPMASSDFSTTSSRSPNDD